MATTGRVCKLLGIALLVATGQCSSLGSRLSRLRQSKVAQKLAAAPNLPRRLPDNATAPPILNTLRKDIYLFERIGHLLWRSLVKTLTGIRTWVSRSVGYPPRVMCVTLSGVIMADDEVRYGSQLMLDRAADELQLSAADGGFEPLAARSRSGDNIINLKNCERQLERAFSSHGARAVCLVLNSPGGSPAQSSNEPIEQAWPMHSVATGGRMNCIVS